MSYEELVLSKITLLCFLFCLMAFLEVIEGKIFGFGFVF